MSNIIKNLKNKKKHHFIKKFNMAEVTPTSGDVVFTPTAILLTGGAGFIGSNAALRILREYPDYKVRGRF